MGMGRRRDGVGELIMTIRQQVILMGKGRNNEPTVVAVENNGVLREPGTPERTPLAASILLTSSSAVELSTAAPDGGEHSHAGWRIVVPSGGAGVLWGPEGYEVSPIEAGDFDDVPSATLTGTFAKSAGADVTIKLIGYEDV